MIDLHKLYIFSIVVQAGSFSAAAEQLYMTQSAVSQHIKDLETQLGQQLFLRSRRGVSLTAHGDTLAGYSRNIFDLVARAEYALTDVAQLAAGKVMIGATPGIGVYVLPEWVRQFRGRFPKLIISLQTGITAQIAADILAFRVDIGIVEGELDDFPAAKLASLALAQIEQLVVVGGNHPLRGRATLRLEELHQQAFIVRQPHSRSRMWLDAALHQYGINPVISAEFDNLESMKRAVAVGNCLAILPAYVVADEVAHHQLEALSLQDKPLQRTLKLIWNAHASLSPVTRAFLNEMRGSYPVLAAVLDVS